MLCLRIVEQADEFIATRSKVDCVVNGYRLVVVMGVTSVPLVVCGSVSVVVVVVVVVVVIVVAVVAVVLVAAKEGFELGI